MSSRILFAPIHGPSLLEMLPIAQKLAKDGVFEPIFFIFRDIPERQLKLLDESKIRQIRLPSTKEIDRKSNSGIFTNDTKGDNRSKIRDLKKRLVILFLSRDFLSFFFYWFKYSRFLVQVKKLLVSENVAAVLVMGDRHIGWETALIKVANDRNLPTLIVPFAVSDPDSDVQGRLRKANVDRYLVSSWFDRIIRRFYPDWVRESEKGPLYFVPIGEAIAAKMLGMMPDMPWSIGGGAARRMAVESPHAMETYLQEGIPREKMIITGKPSIDQIYTRMQVLDESRMRAELGLSRECKIILCSVPQLAEHKLLSWEDHWREIEFLFDSLSQEPDASLVLSLHPQSEPEVYRGLAKRYGAIIAEQRIYDLIPICDILVATYSSVVVQAIGLGKPAVVVDFYDLNFPYYDGEPGVVVIKDRNVLVPILNRLIHDCGFYEKLAVAQNQRASEWILLDGRSTQRVVDKLYQMIEKQDHGVK